MVVVAFTVIYTYTHTYKQTIKICTKRYSIELHTYVYACIYTHKTQYTAGKIGAFKVSYYIKLYNYM